MDLVPDKPPAETEEELDRISRRGGHDIGGSINTDTYEGESFWFGVDKPVVEMERTEVSDLVWQVMGQSTRRWTQVIFLFFRFIPFNPLYKGDELERFQGKWKSWWWATKVVETEYELHRGIDRALSEAGFAAESRMIWCKGFKVRTMNIKPDAPKDWRDRELRQGRRR